MNRSTCRRAAFLLVGIALGLVVGLNLHSSMPPVQLHATATDNQENFAIATGTVDDQTEAVYFLDFLTGDLQAVVLQPRMGKFNSAFKINVLSSLGGIRTKNPKFLMVTGTADIPRGGRQAQLARSVVYVAEATSGQIACFGLPWNPAFQASGRPQQGPLVLIDKFQFRTAEIRD